MRALWNKLRAFSRKVRSFSEKLRAFPEKPRSFSRKRYQKPNLLRSFWYKLRAFFTFSSRVLFFTRGRPHSGVHGGLKLVISTVVDPTGIEYRFFFKESNQPRTLKLVDQCNSYSLE